VSFNNNQYLVEIDKAAIFSNYLGIKRKLEEIPAGFNVTIDLKNTKLVDHSVMENLHRFQDDYEENGGTVKIIGLEKHQPVSEHALAARKAIVS
jgi:MFS superfamily sulfate permease-like transporter